MSNPIEKKSSRRAWLGGSIATVALAACGWPRDVRGQDRCVPTEPNIEGPFHRPGAPRSSHLRVDGEPGTPLTLAGRVLDARCAPMSDAVLEVWHADASGEYDLSGFTHRGQLRADEQGRWRLETIVPGRYLNGATYRPAHVHVKVHANGHPTLTTQLYFPDDPYNDADPWIRSSLILRTRRIDGGLRARFDFVV